MTIEQWLKDVYYDEWGNCIWSRDKDGDNNMIADIRGWGILQYKFKTVEEAEKFHDEVGEFITQAIKEKLSRLPKQEISDEEIEKAANYFYPLIGEQSKKALWKSGCKWYREQLKCKGNDSKSKN